MSEDKSDRISMRRVGAQAVVDQFNPDDLAKMLVHLCTELKDIGITRVTDDLIRLLWGIESIALDFIATSISVTCVTPPCAYASFQHAAAGIDLMGIALLGLEERIGQLL
jgi:hypothetical protein